MMRTKINEHAREKGTYGVSVSFLDSNDNAAAPKTLTWSLTDSGGNVINNKKDVEVITPESIEIIVLKGDDLQLLNSDSVEELRLILLSGTYDDAVLGSDCPIREEISFFVDQGVEVVETI